MNHKLTIRAKCPAGIEQENRYDEEDLLLVTDEHPVYGDCEPPRVRTDAVTLSDIFDNKESWGEAVEMYYEYNHEMGEENWSHQISFLGRADPNLWKNVELLGKAPVVCVSGEGAPCAENCGGTSGWKKLKAAFRMGIDRNGLREWYKNECMNGDPRGLDPAKWDIVTVNKLLRRVKRRDDKIDRYVSVL